MCGGGYDSIVFTKQAEYTAKTSVWSYIFRKEYLEKHGLSLDGQLAWGEDYLFALQLNYRNHIGISTLAKIYNYRQRAGSALHFMNEERRGRHIRNMHHLAIMYRIEYKRCKIEGAPKHTLKYIRRQQSIWVQRVIIDLIFLAKDKRQVKEKIKELKKDKLYPYPILWHQLGYKGADRKFYLKCFLFPIKSYVIFINYLYRRKKKKEI